MPDHSVFGEKIREAVLSVLPITLIVALLCIFLIPVKSGLMLSFLIGSIMITFGMALFTLGSDLSMMQIGNHIGAKMTKSKNLLLILLLSFALGIAITMAEPDLQVLAANAPDIDSSVLIFTVSAGVGFFLMISMLRILFGIPLKWLLIVFYAAVFVIAAFADRSFLSIAFDSGGVTTGPMTVPFIMALGVGVASIRSDSKAKSDSFGLVALCSIGPVIAVLILGMIYNTGNGTSSLMTVSDFEYSVDLGMHYIKELPEYLGEVAIALLPIFAFFLFFQIVSLRLRKRALYKILMGVALTYMGLVMFLTGVNVGFSSLGYSLGGAMISHGLKWLIIPLAMLLGWFIINAEPAVHVLTKQVSELSAGAISERVMKNTLSIAIAVAMGMAMVRVLTGISLMWFLLPGYLIALGLTLFVPATFTAIAFDAGGVASGPLTATFMLPFAMGICSEIGGNIMTDAFGLVALVAMMPLITVQVMGAVSKIKSKAELQPAGSELYGDDEIIELWEAA